MIVIGPLSIDLVKRRALLNERELHLTPIEYRLLSGLARNAGRVMTHQQLFKEAWGSPHQGTRPQYLHVYIGHLREKIEAGARAARS